MSYIYHHVKVNRVIDGDTVEMSVDLGNMLVWKDNFRLMGLDTPERGYPGAAEATEFVRNTLTTGVCRIETFKPGKFGQWLVEIYITGPQGGEMSLNQILINTGHATPYYGGKKEPAPTATRIQG